MKLVVMVLIQVSDGVAGGQGKSKSKSQVARSTCGCAVRAAFHTATDCATHHATQDTLCFCIIRLPLYKAQNTEKTKGSGT